MPLLLLSARFFRSGEPRFELGPAVKQADALLSEPRRTLVSHAAPKLSHATPREPRRTLKIAQSIWRPSSFSATFPAFPGY